MNTSMTSTTHSDELLFVAPATLFDSVLDIPIKLASQIVANDTWFKSNRATERFIMFEMDATRRNVTNALKSNTPQPGYTQIDTSLNPAKPNLCSPELVAAFVFSVFCNKGPALAIHTFLSACTETQLETMSASDMQFVAHIAWLTANGMYGADKDPLCIQEALVEPLVLPELKTGILIFESSLYASFNHVLNRISLNSLPFFIGNEIAKGLEQDFRIYHAVRSGGLSPPAPPK
jgi:hypothetical protein